METEIVTISKTKKTLRRSIPENEVKITLKHYNASTEFIMSVKADHSGVLEDMFRCFVNYFALMKCEHSDVPEWADLRIKELRPMALAVSNELVKEYNSSLQEKLTGEGYLDHWIKQRFQFLQSHYDKQV